MVAVAWSFLYVLGGAMESVVAVPGALGAGIGVRLSQVLEGCDEHRVRLSLLREARGVMEHDLYKRWSAA